MEFKFIEISIIIGAFIIGLIFGFVGQRSRFCILGSITDYYLFKNSFRLKFFFIVLLTAVLGTQTLILSKQINPIDTIFFKQNFYFLSYVIGGILFGFGMTLASGCTSRNIIKIGEGSLKAITVFLITGVTAISSMRGIFAELRINYIEIHYYKSTFPFDLISFINNKFDSNTREFLIIFLLILFIVIIFISIISSNKKFKSIFSAIIIGLTIVVGWYLTGKIGFIPEHPDSLQQAYLRTNSGTLESLTFVGPIGYSLELLMYWSDNSKLITFGITLIAGTLIGSLISSKLNKTFRLESFNSNKDFIFHLLGGFLMGLGGVIASGCTIGHGLSGLSMLFFGSMIVFTSIVLGTIAGIRFLESDI